MKEYGHLLADEPDWSRRAEAFAARVRDVSEVIAGVPLAPAGLRPLRVRVAYQDACHLVHAQRIKQEPRAVIDSIPGVERVEMAESDRCCGSAGIYNLTHPEFADRLALRKISAAVEAGAQRIITSNPGCQVQLAAVSKRIGGPSVQHLVEFLDEAYEHDDDAPHRAPGGLLLAAGAIVIAGLALLVLRRTR
jgi:glycolate oxidase iron-sulfur subunit